MSTEKYSSVFENCLSVFDHFVKLAPKGLRFIRNEEAKTEPQCFVFLDSFLKEKSGPTIAFLNETAY